MNKKGKGNPRTPETGWEFKGDRKVNKSRGMFPEENTKKGKIS